MNLMWGSGKKSRDWINLVAFLLVSSAAVALYRAVPVITANQKDTTPVLFQPSNNETKLVLATQSISHKQGLEPVKLKNEPMTLEEVEKLAQEWSTTAIIGFPDTSDPQTKPLQTNNNSQPTQGCQVNRIIDRLAEQNVKDENEIFNSLKTELNNADCSPCLTKQKMISRLYGAAQQKFNWTETEDVAAQETALIENGLLPKEVSLFSDRTCVFHRDYGYAPDLLASASPLFAAQNTSIGAINQANLSVLGSVYETPLSPSF